MRSGYALRNYCVLFALLALQSGCGNDLPYDSATVTGKVTYQGKLLDHGRVIFVPQEGTRGPQATGVIQSDGTYEMRTGFTPGVASGKHRVMVHCRELPTEQMAASSKEMSPGVLPSLIPAIYGHVNTTPLACELGKGEKREYNITLE